MQCGIKRGRLIIMQQRHGASATPQAEYLRDKRHDANDCNPQSIIPALTMPVSLSTTSEDKI